VAIGPLLGSSWYLRTLKRWAPDLFVPYLDDGQLGPLQARLIERNGRERPVLLEPVGGDGRDLGLLSLLAGAAPRGTDALETWRRYLALERPAELTQRVLGFAAQARASRLADRGQLGAAAAEILATFGVDGSWLQVWEALVRRRLAPIPAFPAWRPMAGSVLRFSRTFLSSTGQAAWHLGDLLFALGLPGLGSFWLDLSATPEAALARALWALRLGDEAELEHSLARLGDRARDGRIAAARAGQTEGRFAAALTVLRPLLTADDPAALALAGVLEAERGDPGAGERLLRRSLEKRPQAIEALTNLGLVYAKQGRFAEARAVWEQASRDPAAHRARALLEKLRAERR
jgi:tetratricopeptide (TPR) repeat protein